MLNPIDTESVILADRLAGAYPDEVHESVAWWVASCFVVVGRHSRIAIADDGHHTTAVFRQRFCRGAINAQHWACQVADLGTADEEQLHHAMAALGDTAGALLTTTDTDGRQLVTIRLFHPNGRPVTDESGLGEVRDMIARDRVPIPVNDQAKGTITDRSDLVGGA